MTKFVDAKGNLLRADVDALVNAVNTVGVMGKGIALQFKKAFPANFEAYKAASDAGQLAVGTMFVYDLARSTPPRWIINFPTKQHWRSKSKMAYIENGLDDLVSLIPNLGVESIAIPPLGCGHGGLDWADVEPLICRKLADLDVTVHLYAPAGAPASRQMPDVR